MVKPALAGSGRGTTRIDGLIVLREGVALLARGVSCYIPVLQHMVFEMRNTRGMQ